MTYAPPTIEAPLRALTDFLVGQQIKVNFNIELSTGQISNHQDARLTNHQKLQFNKKLQAVIDQLNAIPLLHDLDIARVFGVIHHGNASPKDYPSFRLDIAHFTVTKSASSKCSGATSSIGGFTQRMQEVAGRVRADGPLRPYMVNGKTRDRLWFNARSPEQAAWIYAALYVRNGHEAPHWKSTLQTITTVARVYAPEEWNQPDA